MNWTNEPDGGGYYWLKLGELPKQIVKVVGGYVIEHGVNDGESLKVSSYLEENCGKKWQWQKVKPYEQ